MALMTDQRYGVLVVHHGGSLFGYKSDLIFVPEAGIGVVLLTNSDNGQLLLGPLRRRLLEVVCDSTPEAQGNLDAAVASFRAGQAKEERERLQLQPRPPRRRSWPLPIVAPNSGTWPSARIAPPPCSTSASGAVKSRPGRITTGRPPS